MLTPLLALAAAAATTAIDVSAFRDSAHHWRNINQPERVMQAEPGQPAYAPEQVREIAANILLFQRANGGWVKDYDMQAILTDAQQAKIRDTREAKDTSYDNHTTHPQVDYLARAFVLLGEPAYRAACERGLDFMLASQYPNGGFPQRWPGNTGIGGHITFNDGVMMGVLGVLRAAGEREARFAWLDAGRRERARAAAARGLECLLRMQVRADGRLTGWGQQHDAKTLAPTAARTFELASLSPADTVEAVRFLMQLPRPDPEVVAAIEGAVRWLTEVKLTGIRVTRVPAPTEEFFRHKADFDVVVVRDESAPPLWARMIELGTNRPIFASRDGVKVYSLAEVDRERRTGSGWYGNWPARLIGTEYAAWRKRVGAEKELNVER